METSRGRTDGSAGASPTAKLENNVPEELRRRRQWVLWRYEERDGKQTKVPYDARTGKKKRASTADSETWSTFGAAVRALELSPSGYDGVGFVFSSGDPYAGVDLDKCRDPETGEIEEWAAEIVASLGGYVEGSPSGTGVHIVVRGEAPNKKRGDIEAYSSRRYFTVTGDAIGGAGVPASLPERQAELDSLTRRHLLAEDPATGREPSRRSGGGGGYQFVADEKLSDEEVLSLCRKAENAAKFSDLYDAGDTSAYDEDDSRADLALLGIIKFYTQDPAQLERLFGGSALGDRPKWRNRPDYRRGTIAEALSELGETYTPPRHKTGTHSDIPTFRRFPVEGGAPRFPTDVLPAPVARLVDEAAAAIGCPPDAIGLAALVVMGAAIGNSRVIRPKSVWTEGAVIYGAVIADSGEKKTASINAAAGVVSELGLKLEREHEKKLDEHARELREYEVDKRDAAKQGMPAPPPPRPPVEERVHVNDTTIEALIPILKDNPRGVLLERDELVGWANAMDQYKSGGKGAERQFWLSAWSNKGTKVDRKGQSRPLSVGRPFVSVVGSIQPEVLSEISDGRQDGMMERFLFSYPDTINSHWTDDEISDETEAAYRGLYHRLRRLEVGSNDRGQPTPGVIELSEEAKSLYVREYDNHRSERDLPGFPRQLRSPWPKLEAYLLRIILILAACRFVEDGTPERVEVEDVRRGVLLMAYFKDQARRVFGALHGTDPRLRLVEDCARLVFSKGGSWTGTPTELHEQLVSEHKPERPNELSRFLKDAFEDGSGLVYEGSKQSFKDGAGRWRSRRVLTLSIEKRRNVGMSECRGGA